MKNIISKIINFFLSLRTAIWLLMGLILMLLFGSAIMPSRPEFSSINSIPLFQWLGDNRPAVTWWLYGSIVLLSLFTANTLVCSIESLIKKRQFGKWLLIISPQVIHIGFLFILLAHLLSSSGSYKGTTVAYEGAVIALPDGLFMRVKEIKIDMSPSGYVSDWEVDVEYLSEDRILKGDFLKPNSPSFYKGLGIYLKDIQPYPVRAALLEVSREPGAVWALIGGILFMCGTLTLLTLKIKRE